jgi:hypothetical protein
VSKNRANLEARIGNSDYEPTQGISLGAAHERTVCAIYVSNLSVHSTFILDRHNPHTLIKSACWRLPDVTKCANHALCLPRRQHR